MIVNSDCDFNGPCRECKFYETKWVIDNIILILEHIDLIGDRDMPLRNSDFFRRATMGDKELCL